MDCLANDILKYYLLPFLNIPDRKAFKLINKNLYEIERKADDENIYRYRYKLARNKKIAVKSPMLARGRHISILFNVHDTYYYLSKYRLGIFENYMNNTTSIKNIIFNASFLMSSLKIKGVLEDFINVNQITFNYDIKNIMAFNIPEQIEILNIYLRDKRFKHKSFRHNINKPYAFKKHQKLKAFNIVKYVANERRDHDMLPIIKYTGTFKHIDKDIYTVTFYKVPS